ncbi:MAG: polysaccharide biosynthesis tyrosine autokinase [Aquabacterium sp.]|uniref:polysaccharide biosynthesis tyrosine autokinase n=1 Tax=Aquabacterium sp. TaxID=1872578 RepID=UPI00122B2DB4|nr:polysaccharide biosynthesis tyrosine autokinase [Aquabacterium sp.]TAK85117.1 MAG: polysaccharide biosynthesis tyrosine autokinase [Aquabacterium sp.]
MSGNSANNNPSTNNDQSIGDILRSAHNLSAEQVQSILDYQQRKKVRFGEAAVALGILKRDEVIWALSQQFSYPYPQGDTTQPLAPELITATAPFSEEAEFFRDIRSQLISNTFTGDIPATLAVTSPDVGDGKSYFAANLAIVFAQLGVRTLLVDADMRTPVQHQLFRIENTAGLSGILSGRAEPNVIRPCPALPSLYILPVGVTPPNPIELLERPLFGMLLKELSAKFDYVIVDTPAISHGSDGLIAASRAGATITIVRTGETRKPALDKMIGRIENSPTKFAGVIVNEH